MRIFRVTMHKAASVMMSRKVVAVAAAATGATALAVSVSSPVRMDGRPQISTATGKMPEWGTENGGGWRGDWACIGANAGTEDRMVIADTGQGVLCAVYDGHYGPRASEFCRFNSVQTFKQALLQKGATDAPIKKFFQLIEEGWTEYARVLVRRGDWSASMEGSCALVAHVTPEKLMVGNLGDCRAILVQREADGSLSSLQLTREHNASNPAERERVLGEHPGEEDAVQYVKSSGSWYVKGTLQVSRAIGDLFLKNPEFHDALPAHVKPYVGGELKTPPYVSVVPEVVERRLEDRDLFLVLATDGLWDELTNKECLEALKGVQLGGGQGAGGGAPKGEQWGWMEGEDANAGSKLLWTALRQNPISRRFGVEFLLDLEPGSNRRQVHDDISIVVLWLQPSLRPSA